MHVNKPSGGTVQVSESDWPPELPQYDFFKHQMNRRTESVAKLKAKAILEITSQQHRERSISYCNTVSLLKLLVS